MIFSCTNGPRGFYYTRFEYSPSTIEQLKQYPGPSWHPGTKSWLIPKELAQAGALSGLGKWRLPKETPTEPITVPEAREFQQLTLNNIQKEKSWLVSYETGLGKTPVAIWALAQTTPIGHTLIVCPGSIRNQWKFQINKFAPQLEKLVLVAYETGDIVDFLLSEKKILITSPELLARVSPNFQFMNIIIDESQCIKNPKAQITKTIHGLSSAGGLKLCLSATPIGNEAFDIWTQLEFLWPGRFGSFYKFLNYYALHEVVSGTNRQGEAFEAKKYIGLNPAREAALKQRLESCHDRASLSNPVIAKQVPPVILDSVRIRVNHAHAQMPLIDEEDASALAFDPMRQHQIHVENQQLKFTSSRVEAGVELALNEVGNGRAIIIVTYHTKVARAIYDKLIASHVKTELLTIQDTDVKRETKARNILFSGGVLVVSMKLINKGVDYLKMFDLALLVELYWSPEVMIQLLGRFRRIGGKTVVIKTLIIENSIDEVIAMEIERKISDSNKLMQSIDAADNLINLFTPNESDEEWAKRLSVVANTMGIDGYGEYNFDDQYN